MSLVKKADLILLDIDDVIITPVQYLCSSTWYANYHAQNKLKLTPHELISDFYKCMNNTNYKVVSDELVKDFTSIINEKPVLGFTARTHHFAQETFNKVQSVGMKFTTKYDGTYDYIKNGIIYVGYNLDTVKSNNKGELLNSLLQSKEFLNFKTIIFIDDTLRNIEEVESKLSDDIYLYNIHYTEAKARLLCDFDEEMLNKISKAQLKHMLAFNEILSNQDALSILQCVEY